ncbi:MAG: thiamine pyrophosphate-requiring protein [Burkholderiaceae bacterium]|nr:thiamine pyrophosphate-requiring protein [Burkholderiaceae bacterium]
MTPHGSPDAPANLRDEVASATGSRVWPEVPASDVGEAIVEALTLGGIDHLFFTSGTEIGFYQEAIAKARALGRKAPRLVTVTHEHVGLNAALGYAAISGRPAATAVHVDSGTQHCGGAIHTAWHSGLPVLMTAGAAPSSYPGSMPGARDGGGHIWMQQARDQNGIVRCYTKWDHRLEQQDNAGLVVSRALQVARTEPCGPVYLSIPREIPLRPASGVRFPPADQLAIPRPPAPDPDGVHEIARRLVAARNPFVVVSRSGRDPQCVPALVELCELLAVPVVDSNSRAYHCFPMNHPLYQRAASLATADFVLVLEAAVPWLPGESEPPARAYVAVVGIDPIQTRIPTFEFTANIRLISDSLLAIRAITAAAHALLSGTQTARLRLRAAHWNEASRLRAIEAQRRAQAVSRKIPIDPLWLSAEIGRVIDDDCTIFDETMPQNGLHEYLGCPRPGSYFYNPGSSGGWAPGAALGAKLAAPDRQVVAVTGDGFYMFAVPNAAISAAVRHHAPFLTIVYQNRSYSTGVTRVAKTYPAGYAMKAGFDGGYFDPPIDFAKEAEAAGGHGENVTDPGQIRAALERGLDQVRGGKPAVISVWLPRLMQED